MVETLELGKKMQVLVFCFLIQCLVTQETEAQMKKGPGAGSGWKAEALPLQVREQCLASSRVPLLPNPSFPPEAVAIHEDQRHFNIAIQAPPPCAEPLCLFPLDVSPVLHSALFNCCVLRSLQTHLLYLFFSKAQPRGRLLHV